jgi:glutamine synthetase
MNRANRRMAAMAGALRSGSASPEIVAAKTLDGMGANCFTGAVAEKYLSRQGASAAMLADPSWTEDEAKADIVAAAVLDWAVENGADLSCHWFQPLASNGVRHGQSAQVQNQMIRFDKDNVPFYKFDGDDLLSGETDGSSYNNGGMRATHTAGGYLKIDPTSPIFLREDTVFIPACFCSWNGDALDEKTPLLRSTQALSEQGTRLLGLMGYDVDSLTVNIGLEQEMFLVPRPAFYKRPDLQFCGRTLLGRMPARGQEMSDHYMGPPSKTTAALSFFRDVQEDCLKLGIPLTTRHREVAPGQYEMAPFFGPVQTQIDQNLMVMQILEEAAAKNGLACLMQEKPFQGINGSGKHNNWSISTSDGTQLLVPKSINEASGNDTIFPVVMAALVSAVDKHGDMMRMAIASPGNDFRLGAMEAPPAVMSTYLGDSMTQYLDDFMNGKAAAYNPTKKPIDFGADAIGELMVPTEDRNRTSPFPYGGGRFEFRAVGSTQNTSMVNTVLNSMTAEAFKTVADRIEAGEDAVDVARALLKEHSKVIFNGNGYEPTWPDEAVKKGIWRIDSGVDAICELTSAKNIELFGTVGVFTEAECHARKSIMLGQYVATVEMEAQCLIDMVNQHVIPDCTTAGLPTADIEATLAAVVAGLEGVHHAEDDEEAQAALCRVLRLETMVDARGAVEEQEALCPPSLWSLASYKDLLFLDTHPGNASLGEKLE